jgi:hypothetical protein
VPGQNIRQVRDGKLRLGIVRGIRKPGTVPGAQRLPRGDVERVAAAGGVEDAVPFGHQLRRARRDHVPRRHRMPVPDHHHQRRFGRPRLVPRHDGRRLDRFVPQERLLRRDGVRVRLTKIIGGVPDAAVADVHRARPEPVGVTEPEPWQ